MQDVARTFPEEDYFRQPCVQKIMCDILFVYAKVHSSLQYRQGMHELLGPLLMVVDGDSVDANKDCVLGGILDKRFVEHDTFAMFDRLMRLCLPWYQSPSFTSPPLRPTIRNGATAEDKQAAIEAMKAHTPIIAQCYMMMEKLEAVDPRLAVHLQTLDIEPQLFGIRWYRLLFSREFMHLNDVLVLWGMLFADNHGGSLRLVDWIGVVLLLANRRQLLLGDYADNLNTLLHLPPLPSPTQDTLDQTPPLLNAPLSPNQFLVASAGAASDMSLMTPKIPYSVMTQHGVLPIQRLALQAAYLRSRPSPETATLVTSQYEVWEDEAWDVIEETEALKKDIVDGARKLAVDSRRSESPNARHQTANTGGGGGSHSVASAPIAVTWQGRKMYTSNTLQHRRANGTWYGGASPKSSPSSPPMAARMAGVLGEPSGAGLQSQIESSNQISMDVVSPTESNDGRTPAEAVRALGSVTAQVSTMAAQCVDLVRIQGGTASKAHLDVLGAALHMISQVWQDEVVRSSSTSLQQQGLRTRSPDTSSPGIRSRKMSEADLRVMLRDLDRVYVELSSLR
ncbi:hypothetical protein GGI23_006069, partial [Coemansia sp. RSA 2559]